MKQPLPGPPPALLHALAAALPEVEIGQPLGHGAGGWVLGASDRASGEECAVKVLGGEDRLEPFAVERMRTEAGILTTLSHPHLPRAFRFHEFDDLSVLVMERIFGATAFELVSGGAPPLPVATSILVAAAEALDFLHEHGWLHGDVKPENVLVETGGQHRLIDLALAKKWPLLVNEQVSGTPSYMAPETIRGGELVPATDVYALGMMAYELFTGHLPYPPASGEIDVMRQQLELQPLPLVVAAPHLPRDVTTLVMRAIEKDVGTRLSSAGEFAHCLATAVDR